jgi:hypothetical protein
MMEPPSMDASTSPFTQPYKVSNDDGIPLRELQWDQDSI